MTKRSKFVAKWKCRKTIGLIELINGTTGVPKTRVHVAEERVNKTPSNRATRRAEYPSPRISRVIAFRARIERLIEFELQHATHGVKKNCRAALSARVTGSVRSLAKGDYVPRHRYEHVAHRQGYAPAETNARPIVCNKLSRYTRSSILPEKSKTNDRRQRDCFEY